MTVHSSYLNAAFTPKTFKGIVTKAIRDLKKHTKEFDAIAFRGFSGSVIGPIIALALGKKMIFVRKGTDLDHAHSCMRVEGADCNHYLIIDDFIASGNTVKMIQKEITDSNVKGKAVAIYLWKAETYYSTKESYEGLPIWK